MLHLINGILAVKLCIQRDGSIVSQPFLLPTESRKVGVILDCPDGTSSVLLPEPDSRPGHDQFLYRPAHCHPGTRSQAVDNSYVPTEDFELEARKLEYEAEMGRSSE